MAHILVLGTGLQGKAALYFLAQEPDISQITAADADLSGLMAFLSTLRNGDKIRPIQLDATDENAVAQLFSQVDAVVMLLPSAFRARLAPLAVDKGIHWVDASYTDPEFSTLASEALDKGVAILPEFGLDPGLDLLLAARVIAELDTVHEFYSYGAGIPEPAAAHNPLAYKISWTFRGVLDGYSRPARLLKDGQSVEIPAAEIFDPDNIHYLEIGGLGQLEAYPNGDAVRYVNLLGLNEVRHAARYSMRWPGHSAFWRVLSRLGFLDDAPIASQAATGKVDVSPRRFLHDLLEPQLQYGPEERDAAIVRVDAKGVKDGQARHISYEIIDFRDLASGLLAMQRTVGFTAAVGARLILQNTIGKRGLLSPLTDVPPVPVFAELARQGIKVSREETSGPNSTRSSI